MAKRDLPTPDVLRQLLRYDEEAGVLFWRERPASFFREGRGSYTQDRAARSWNKRYAGREALSVLHPHSGHKSGRLLGKMAKAHRVAWAVYHGNWPDGLIDHIDGDPTNNRIENLRVVHERDNARNRAIQHDNTSGCAGVSWHKKRKAWYARIGRGGRRVSLGYYPTKEAATEARLAAELSLGYHPNHGRSLAPELLHYAKRRRADYDRLHKILE